MPGGYLQLAAYGSQDFYLTGNPQISFFKTVYRRYTNFAMDYVRIHADGNIGLSETEVVTYKFKIERNADLISNIYFSFTLPDIYSGNGTDFRWIKNIGFNIISKVSIYIGGSLIDEHYGEWFDIWNELTIEESKKENFNKMIGNIPELYDPANAPGNNGYYPQKIKGDTKIPSIEGLTIRVPLIFWFNRNPSLALPLVALQYEPVQINIEIKKLADLYTIVDTNFNNRTFGTRIKPEKNISDYSTRYSIHNFVDDPSIITGEGANTRLANFVIDPFLDINYIFLDNEEMKKFAKSEHKYLIEQVRRSEFKGILGSDTLNLLIHHPTSYMVIVAKRNDSVDRNDWNNYTNWIDEKIPPFSEAFNNIYYEKYWEDTGASEKATETNYLLKKSPFILNSLQLKLNGIDRFTSQSTDFFNRLVPQGYAKRIPKDGIMFYSFSINPFDYQPSGSCNMSRFNSIELFLETVQTPIPSELNENLYKFDINVYTVNYNILRISSGMGNVEFSN